MEFWNGKNVLLKVSPMKRVTKFSKKSNISLRYIGPLEVLESVGPVAYRLSKPPKLYGVFIVFHMSMLKKYYGYSNNIIMWDSIVLDRDLQYDEKPIDSLIMMFVS